jgi:hypothetical protein
MFCWIKVRRSERRHEAVAVAMQAVGLELAIPCGEKGDMRRKRGQASFLFLPFFVSFLISLKWAAKAQGFNESANRGRNRKAIDWSRAGEAEPQ